MAGRTEAHDRRRYIQISATRQGGVVCDPVGELPSARQELGTREATMVLILCTCKRIVTIESVLLRKFLKGS